MTMTDPRILRDVDRKARQVLIDMIDPEIIGASLAEIKEKVHASIVKITDLPPPEGSTVLEVNKLCKGGFTILFKDKEAINWLQDLVVEFEFTTSISSDTFIDKCTYSILVPHIPTMLDLSNETHLREVEECNSIPVGSIVKARWIKLAYRRTPGQRAAHTIFVLRDIDTANNCIRDSIKVCSLHIQPCRLKHEPMQCMRCRKWGHFTHTCTAPADTCGMLSSL